MIFGSFDLRLCRFTLVFQNFPGYFLCASGLQSAGAAYYIRDSGSIDVTKNLIKSPPPQFVCNIYRKQVPAADDVVGVTSRVSYRHLCVHIDHLGPLQLRDGTGRDGRRYRGRPSHPTAHGRRAPTTNRKCMPVKCRDPLRTTARWRVHRPEGDRESGSRATRN